MGKRNVNISIDEFIHDKAKEKRLNVSAICELALRNRVELKKSDAPEESIKLKCFECHELFDEGFICENLHRFYCSQCHDKCPGFRLELEHIHLKVPGYCGENIEIMKKIAQNGSKRENEQ